LGRQIACPLAHPGKSRLCLITLRHPGIRHETGHGLAVAGDHYLLAILNPVK
jgi:hypothetical protein